MNQSSYGGNGSGSNPGASNLGRGGLPLGPSGEPHPRASGAGYTRRKRSPTRKRPQPHLFLTKTAIGLLTQSEIIFLIS